MKKALLYFLIIMAIVTAISLVNYLFFTSDSEKFEMEINRNAEKLKEAESINELDAVYAELDSMRSLDQAELFTAKFDSLRSLKASFVKKFEMQERAEKAFSAYYTAKEVVSKNLKAPATATFSSYEPSNITYYEDGVYTVLITVDAQNSFGAMIRSTYQVNLKDQGESWKFIDLVKSN